MKPEKYKQGDIGTCIVDGGLKDLPSFSRHKLRGPGGRFIKRPPWLFTGTPWDYRTRSHLHYAMMYSVAMPTLVTTTI